MHPRPGESRLRIATFELGVGEHAPVDDHFVAVKCEPLETVKVPDLLVLPTAALMVTSVFVETVDVVMVKFTEA